VRTAVVGGHNLDVPVLLDPIQLVLDPEVGKLDRAVEVRQVVFPSPLFDFTSIPIGPAVAS